MYKKLKTGGLDPWMRGAVGFRVGFFQTLVALNPFLIKPSVRLSYTWLRFYWNLYPINLYSDLKLFWLVYFKESGPIYSDEVPLALPQNPKFSQFLYY